MEGFEGEVFGGGFGEGVVGEGGDAQTESEFQYGNYHKL